ENSWGSDTREYPVINVEEASAIESVGSDNNDVKAYTVEKTLFLEFAEAGHYKVDVFNAAGQLAASRKRDMVAGQLARIDLPTAGIYMVRISNDNGTVRTIKVANK
ncbi:MAG: T9SS type A sorting domain-containing protein, partial [Paramuribaculum sp.]|nr:T9SS type A sorting domain-containing protein [Paramuribaculum sp.]